MNINSGSTEYISIAFSGAIGISLIAYKLRLLSFSGMIAAAFTGGAVFAFGGISASVLLLIFFLSGSSLGKMNQAKGERRNWKQVLCNGAIPALAVIIILFRHDLREEMSLLFLGALATATADTWATEIGMRFGKRIYNIVTFHPMTKGLSGGISLVGILASAIGAFVIGAVSLIKFLDDDPLCGLVLVKVIPVITISGFCGALLDSIIGATLQAKFRLPDGLVTEIRTESAIQYSGVTFITNNATNLIATLWGGIIAIWLGAVL